jgi:two-component system OmpR family response regulator
MTAMTSRSRGFGSVRVLLVDDHAALAEATAEFLRFSGLEVRTALDGKEALALAKAFRPQLVLCDLRLPDASGLEVVKALQTTLDPKQVIFTLHTAMTESEVRSFQSHVDVQVISKPLTESKLNKLLDELHTKTTS